MNCIYLIDTCGISIADLPQRFNDYKPELKDTAKKINSFLAYEFLKHIACELLNTDKDKITIKFTENGKPYIENSQNFYFSISHSENIIAVAIADSEIGVDIEKIRAINTSLSGRFFTKNEIDYIEKNTAKNNDTFFELWTKKEAYIKQKGLNLSHLSKIDVTSDNIKNNFLSCKADNYFLSAYSEADITFKIIKINKKHLLP